MTPAARTVSRAREFNASPEAIIRAALSYVPLKDGMAILDKLRTELQRRQQEATHNAPIGGPRNDPTP